MVAIAVIAVTSWVLNVAAKAPSLAACKPVDRGGNSVLYAGDGSKLGVIASEEAARPGRDRPHPARASSWRRWRSRTSASTSTAALDPEGILRAALKDLEAGEAVEGGSTITQQLVRNLCIRHPARNLERKIVEAKLAIEYAERHSKREILGQYLNTASYGTIDGSTAIGVQAASRIYFSRPVWKLSLAQEALLAGLPQAPSEYNPILHPRRRAGAAQRGAGEDGEARLRLPRPGAGGRAARPRAEPLATATSSTASPTSSTTSKTG